MARYSGIWITDGLSDGMAATRYAQRRRWLKSNLDHPVLLVSPLLGPDGGHPWAHVHRFIFQDPYLLYLTGINQLPMALWLDPSEETDIILLPAKSDQTIFWEGMRWGAGDIELETMTGLHSIPARSFHRLIQSHPVIGATTSTLAMGWPMIKRLRRQQKLVPIDDVMWTQRLCLDEIDQHNLAEAVQKSNRAFRSVLQNWGAYRSEQDVHAALLGAIYHESPYGPSFPCIVGAGGNAATLHYVKNDEPFPLPTPFHQHGMVLIDFGVRWHAMHADITRVVPIGGQFSNLQSELVSLVCDTAHRCGEMIQPGVLLDDINQAAWSWLNEGIQSMGISFNRPYSNHPHQIGHLLGHQVHDGDGKRSYRNRPLQPGMALTIEPGLYGTVPELGGIGIRWEDNYVVTPTGSRCLSSMLPQRPSEIEASIRQ